MVTTRPRPFSGRRDIPRSRTCWLEDLRPWSQGRHEAFRTSSSQPAFPAGHPPLPCPGLQRRRSGHVGLILPHLPASPQTLPITQSSGHGRNLTAGDTLPGPHDWSAHRTSSTPNPCPPHPLHSPHLGPGPSSLAREILPKHKSDPRASSPKPCTPSLLPRPSHPLQLLSLPLPEKLGSSTFRTCTRHLPEPRKESTSLDTLPLS